MKNRTEWKEQFKTEKTLIRMMELFENFTLEKCAQIPEIYDTDMYFEDPFKTILKNTDLLKYMEKQAKGVKSCHFIYHNVVAQKGEAFISWSMSATPKISFLRPIVLDGASHVKWVDSKITFHRDYFNSLELLKVFKFF